MKKIMFNDKYGLTRAVLDGRKTQTRRIACYWDNLDITSKDVKRQKLDDGTWERNPFVFVYEFELIKCQATTKDSATQSSLLIWNIEGKAN